MIILLTQGLHIPTREERSLTGQQDFRETSIEISEETLATSGWKHVLRPLDSLL